MGNAESETGSVTQHDTDTLRPPGALAERSSNSSSGFSVHLSDLECLDFNDEDDDDDDQNDPDNTPNTTNNDSTDIEDEDCDTITMHIDDDADIDSDNSGSIFMFNFVPKSIKPRHKRRNTYLNFKYYGDLLSNALLNCNNNDDIKAIESLSYDICWIIIDFLELNIWNKALILTHNSYYTMYKYKNEMNKIRNIIGRVPMRNTAYHDIKPFIYIGSDALRYCPQHKHSKKQGKQIESSLSFPIKNNVIRCDYNNTYNERWNVDKDLIEIWKYIMDVEVGVDIEEHPLLLITPSQTPWFSKEALIKFVFSEMNVDRFCILDRNILTLSVLNCGTGLMVNISGDICSITPVIQFKVHQNAMILSTFHCAQRMNDDMNIKINNLSLKCKISESKEEYEEMIANGLSASKMDFLLFKNGESLFNAVHSVNYGIYRFDEFIQKIFDVDDIKRKDNVKGLHALIMDVICEFDDELLRRELMKNIVVYGSDQHGICTPFNTRNIEKRLLNELTMHYREYEDVFNVFCLSQSNVDIHYAAHLTQFKEFQMHWMTKDEYLNTNNMSSLCIDKWNVTQSVNQKFNELINDTFYESLLFQSFYGYESLPLSPLC